MFVLILMMGTVLQYFALLFWIVLQNMIGFLRQCIGGLIEHLVVSPFLLAHGYHPKISVSQP